MERWRQQHPTLQASSLCGGRRGVALCELELEANAATPREAWTEARSLASLPLVRSALRAEGDVVLVAPIALAARGGGGEGARLRVVTAAGRRRNGASAC